MKISVIGAGYVGLVTGACFASKDNFVVVVERDEKKIKNLLTGVVPFYEPGLDLLVKEALKNKKLIFVQEIKEALTYLPEAIFSCVGTPPKADGSPDLSCVYSVVREIGKNLNDYCVVVNKSTVPVGTTKEVEDIIGFELKKRGKTCEFDVASNPEFLKEGSAVGDFLFPDRIVVGVRSKEAEDILRKLYRPFCNAERQFMVMSPESSELTKYASNSMLAMRISFMNQLALLADKVGADIKDVKKGIGQEERIGKDFLNAGIGYGGSCFPKDVKALVSMGEKHGQTMSLVKEVDVINDNQRVWFADQIVKYYGDKLKGKCAGIWGLSFKPETDDIRCAPSIYVISRLLENGCNVIAYDPVASENVKAVFRNKISFATSSREVLESSDFLLLLTEWKKFLNYLPCDFLSLKDKVVFDGRNCFEPDVMSEAGVKYFSVGRNSGNKKESAFCYHIPWQVQNEQEL